MWSRIEFEKELPPPTLDSLWHHRQGTFSDMWNQAARKKRLHYQTLPSLVGKL